MKKNTTLFRQILPAVAFCSLMTLMLSSCQKGYLDAKPSKALVVPSTISDFQALLDDGTTMNSSTPYYGNFSADEFYTDYASWQSFSQTERDVYVWSKTLSFPNNIADWDASYKQVYSCNIAMDGISKISQDATNQSAWNNVMGSALFYRANAFYNLSQEFAKTYDAATSNQDIGIVLKLDYNVQTTYTRATVMACYNQIIGDLLQAESLLPVTPLYKTRPSKPGAEGLLARTYLVMGDYDKAFQYADAALASYNKLIDYNTLSTTVSRPLIKFNDETVFYDAMSATVNMPPFGGIVDTTLYRSYDSNDLRKVILYTVTGGNAQFKGVYTGQSTNFSGIATDELYLIRAECYSRKGNTNAAMSDLNTLLAKRWKAGTFVPLTATSPDNALLLVLNERKKELPFRGLRWTDIRRLNKDARFAVTLTRNLNGQLYTLPPNDNRFALPIPQYEINLSGISQNPR